MLIDSGLYTCHHCSRRIGGFQFVTSICRFSTDVLFDRNHIVINAYNIFILFILYFLGNVASLLRTLPIDFDDLGSVFYL